MNFAFVFFSFLLVVIFHSIFYFFLPFVLFFKSTSEAIISWSNKDIESLNDSCSHDSENDDNTITGERNIEEILSS